MGFGCREAKLSNNKFTHWLLCSDLKYVEESENKKMNLRKCILTNNACYKAGKTIIPKGIMVHSTGANNPNLSRYVAPDDGLLGVNKNNNHWNQDSPDGRKVCVHAFIGKLKDGSIATYQTLPWNHLGWHSGGDANNTHIGFEICEDDLIDSEYFRAVFNEAVELCAYLCKQYNLSETDIICHSEGWKKGIASNHSDVMHWFPKHGESMDTFRAAVKKALSNNTASPSDPALGTSSTSSAMTREECRNIIQSKCNFSEPAAVWKAIETHPFADDLYRKLAAAMK